MSSRTRLPLELLGATALGLSGCMVGPNFHAPRPAVPAAYLADAPPRTLPYVTGDAVDPAWWNSFNDPELTRLEALAVSQNLDLEIATERLVEAEAQAQVEGATLYPSLSGAASYTREGISNEGIFSQFAGGSPSASTTGSSVANGSSQSGGGGGIAGSAIQPFDLYQYGLQAMYDVDLWGKNRRTVEAAVAAARASEEARRASLLNVESQVASNYIQLRGTQTVLDITQRNLGFANQLVNLTVQRQQAGLTTSLDVANARATAAQISSQIPGLLVERDNFIDQIGMLLGITPNALPPELLAAAPVPATPPQVPVGLPADLLRRRPDVREAEQTLHQATAEVGVAVAQFFPDLELSGSVSLQALQFKNLNEFKALTYGFGPSLSIPIFAGGQLNGQLRLRKADEREAAISYASTVLTAFYQVDNALVAYTQQHVTLADLTIDVQQSQIAQNLAEDQYKQGLADYLTVLNAQETYLNAQQTQAQAVERLATDLVTLYQALGGGWQQTFPAPDQPAPNPAAPSLASPAPVSLQSPFAQ